MTMESLAGVRGVARQHSTQGNTGDPALGVTLVREPDAGKPHVRFDERMWETPDRCGWR